MAKPRIKNNVNRFQKYATVYISKALQEEAELFDLNIKRIIKDKLQETYIDNLRASYTPRTIQGQETVKYNEESGIGGHKKKLTYRHTGILANSVYTKIDGNNIKVMIKDEQHPGFASTTQIYKWLTEGTKGSDKPYPYLGSHGVEWAQNYPTPAHLFEEHTKVQMKGFLDTLIQDIRNENDKERTKTLKRKYGKYIKQ